jgi:hypothetical protein
MVLNFLLLPWVIPQFEDEGTKQSSIVLFHLWHYIIARYYSYFKHV